MDPTTSLLVVTFAAVLVSIVQTVITARTVDPKKMQTFQAELKVYLSELEAAKKSSDEKLLKKIEEKKKYMDSLESEITGGTLKMSLYSLVFALALYYGLAYLYQPGQIVASIPTYLWDPTSGIIKIDYFWWYAVAAVFFSTIVRKIMKVG